MGGNIQTSKKTGRDLFNPRFLLNDLDRLQKHFKISRILFEQQGVEPAWGTSPENN